MTRNGLARLLAGFARFGRLVRSFADRIIGTWGTLVSRGQFGEREHPPPRRPTGTWP